MKFLVLGGTGFIGSKISKRLADVGHNITVFSPSAGRVVFQHDNIATVSGWIADKGEMYKQIAEADAVLHFVSSTNPKTSFSDPHHDITSNLLPMVQLLDMMKEHPGKQLIFCSSGGAVYGTPQQFPVSEDHPRHPATPYGMVKMAMEDYIQFYHQNYGIPFLILRPANVYGPKLRSIGEQGIISTLVYNALHNRPTTLWANPNNIRDYIFIDDFVDALMSLLSSQAEGIFNIGSGKGYSLAEIISAVQSVSGKTLQIVFQEEKLPDEPANVLDITKITALSGWRPQTKLEDGINAILQQLSI
jgi:UDP-glucose 4-epimerase